MTVPSTIGSLSTTASSNSPAGSENVFPDLDNHLRAGYSFIAQLHAGTNKPSWSAAGRIPFFDASGNYATASTFVRDASGYVGIGAATPLANLDINDGSNTVTVAVRTGLTKAAILELAGNGAGIGTTSFALSQTGDSVAGVLQRANAALYFGTNATERMRINAGGGVLIGLSSTLGSGVSGQLHLASSGSGGQLYMRHESSSSGKYWSFGPDGAANALVVYNQSGIGMYMSDGANSWTSASDERLKTDLTPITNAADKVSGLRAVTGRYKTDEPGISRAFLIAQDVQKVLPEAVDTQPDGTLGVRYNEVIPLLVAAINDLQARVKALEA